MKDKEFDTQLEKVIQLLDELSIRTNEIGQHFHGKKGSEIKLVGFVYLDLLQRINSNLEGLLVLLKNLKTSPELKIPISLILRGCLADVLTGYYLNSFLADDETFSNEIMVLGLDYINYAGDMIHNEPLFTAPKISEDELKETIKNKMKSFAANNDELIKSYNEDEDKWIKYKVKELRETSSLKVFADDKERSFPPTDKFKFERLKSFVELKDASYVYVLMRFFAQFQHYAYYNRNVLELDILENFKLIIQSLYYINHAVLDFSRIIKADKDLLDKVRSLLENYKDLSGLKEVE
jgi:hypothetical protein